MDWVDREGLDREGRFLPVHFFTMWSMRNRPSRSTQLTLFRYADIISLR